MQYAHYTDKENTNDPKRLNNIIGALQEIGRDLPLILPLHPRTKYKNTTSI